MVEEDNHDDRSDALSRIISAAFGPVGGPDEQTIDSILFASTMTSSMNVRELTRDLEDRYELLSEISRGGMGIVWMANDRALGRRVAVKTLTDRSRRHPGMVHRLVEEARICGRLEHPGIVPLHDFGFLPSGDPFLVMRLVEGKTLADLLTRRADTSDDQLGLIKVFEQVCTATAHAHERGFLHRDLKPSNVMVGGHGETQVMDWGLAKSIHEPPDAADTSSIGDGPSRSEAARRGSIVGTASYMAPEQARGEVDLDARCDVFSLGAILFEVLTGRRVYAGADNEETLRLAASADLEAAWAVLDASRSEPDLAALVRRCLATDRAERPTNGAAVAGAVSGYLSRLAARKQEAEVATAAARAKAEEERRVRRITVALTILVAAAILVAVAVWNRLESERREQRQNAKARVSVALERAVTLRDQARSSSRGAGVVPWNEAAAAAREALDLANQQDDSTARPVLEEIIAEKDRYLSMVALELEFDDLRPHIADDRTFHVINSGLKRAFLELDIDVDGQSVEVAAERVRSSPIREILVPVLEDWSDFRRRRVTGDKPSASRLMEIAIRADDQPWRGGLRRAVAARDIESLREIAVSSQIEEASPSRLDLLARSLHWAGDRAESIRLYRWAHVRFPGDARLAHNLAVFLKAQPDPPVMEIARLLGSAVSLEPENAHYRGDLGLALGRANDIDGALAVFAWLETNHPRYARGWFLKGQVLADHGRVEEAIAAFAQATRWDKTWARAWSNHGSNLAQSGRVEDSYESFERGIAVDPEMKEEPLGLVQARLRRLRKSIPSLLRTLELKPGDAPTHASLGAAYVQLGRIAEAIHHLRAGLEGDDESVEMWVNLSLALSVSGDWEGALESAERACDLDDDSMTACYLVGTSLYRLGRFDESVAELQQARKMGYVPGGGFMTPRILVRDVRQAQRVAARAASLGPGESLPDGALGTYARILACRGRHAESVRMFQRYLEEREGGIELLLEAARAALTAAREEGGAAAASGESREELLVQAREWLEEAVDSFEWHPAFHFWAAYVFADREIAALRNGPGFESLDADEAERWESVWARVQSLIPVISD